MNQITNPVLPTNIQSLTGLQYMQKILPNLIGILFVVGSVVFFFMMLLGAIQWISSGGDKVKIEAARGKITAALIGLVIMFSVYALVKILETFFGVSILTLDIGPLIIQ